MSIIDALNSRLGGYLSLGADINKVSDENRETEPGVISDLLPELKLDMDDKELLDLSRKWSSTWDKHYKDKLEKKQKVSEAYWLGLPNDIEKIEENVNLEGKKPNSDNLIFEALETFLPVATRQNPEPIVSADNTLEGIELSKNVEKMLAYLADVLRLKLKIKNATRNWALYYLGCIKIGWSEKENDITVKVIRPQRLILDPNAYIEEGVYQGEYIGEHKIETAEMLAKRFPNKKKEIEMLVKGKMGTELNYIEWWTDTMLFWTLKNVVLDKIKNPHWNYDEVEEVTKTIIDENGEEIAATDEFGIEIREEVTTKGSNHFTHPAKPYSFLTCFNLGTRPYDNTSLIEQNIKQQDIINKRQKQIDENVDNMNGGWVVSGARAGMTKQQASLLIKEVRAGGLAYIPDGDANNAINKVTGSSLPADVFNSMQDARNELRSIFGTTGLTAQGIASEDTVRGKIITREGDSSRIGGGVAEYIEQFADYIFNWMVQMMYVYYDEEHAAAVIGKDSAREYIVIKNEDLNRKLKVSVKEGSLIPKDSLTQRNEAVDLWGAGALDPVTLFERLEYPDPMKAAERLLMWQQGQISGSNQQQVNIQPNQEQPQMQEPMQTPPQDLLNQVPIQ